MGDEQRERQREGGWENGKKGEKEAALERERERKKEGGTHTGSRRKICLPQQRMGEGVGKACPLKEQDRPFITFPCLFYNKTVGS